MTTFPPCRAVITGIGCVNPFGSGGYDVVVNMIRTNTTAIRPIVAFPTDNLTRHLGAEIPDTYLIQTEEARRWSRVSQLAVTACRHAVTEAQLDDPEVLHSFGLVIGSEFGDLRSTEAFDAGFLRRGPRGLRAFLFPNTVMNSMAGTVSIALGLKGPMLTLNQSGVAGEIAVARATALLAANRAPAVIACGVDELFQVLYDALVLLNVPSPHDGSEEACRPFDQRHNGPILGESATAIVLETPEHAKARGAPILAKVRSACWGGLSARPHHYPQPAQLHHRLLAQTLATASVSPQDIGVAYLSGCGDPPHDEAELALLTGAFGAKSPWVTSLTHLAGEHGSLGALRVAAAVVTATSSLLPTLDYLHHPIRSDVRFATHPVPSPQPHVLVHGLARGGSQAVLLISPPS